MIRPLRAAHAAGTATTGVALSVLLLGTTALAADCPSVTVADMGGLTSAYPEQFELAEFQAAADCTLTFQENPAVADLNARIDGNPDLPPLAERLPAEPLVVVPYAAIGQYGGVLNGLSNATEAGTSDMLSVRHVNLVRYADDLQTVVPNVAKSWEWNDDYTQLTMHLRKGHKWSDGAPFTSADIKFWYEDLILNPEIYPETPSRWLFEGKPMQVDTPDETTVVFSFPVPAPGIINRFAVDYGQPFQPRHFLEQFHIKYNPDADALATEHGKEGWADLLNEYYGGSDWKDVPSPLIDQFDTRVVPTLESHILVDESSQGRHLVANPYFHMVDTAGHQLPYINEIEESYAPDKQVRNLMITNGDVDYKQQATYIEDFPLYKENEDRGGYSVDLAPGLGETVFYAFNTTHKDEGLREIFGMVKFREAMSLALNRDEINDVVFLGQGEPEQSAPVEHRTVSFVTPEHLHAFIDYDPEQAKALLDEIGVVDQDGDGLRDRLDGKPLVIRLQYSNQGAPVRMHELAAGYWRDVGIRVDLKEVTSDEYRAQAGNNDLDMTGWRNDNTSGASVSQTPWKFVPPFGGYFNPGTGWGWAAWHKSDGAEGMEPPEDVKALYPLADKFLQAPLGSAESDRIGAELVDIHVRNLWKIGTVGGILAPIVHHDSIANFPEMKAKTYDYYWSYPYRPQQWFFSEENN